MKKITETKWWNKPITWGGYVKLAIGAFIASIPICIWELYVMDVLDYYVDAVKEWRIWNVFRKEEEET